MTTCNVSCSNCKRKYRLTPREIVDNQHFDLHLAPFLAPLLAPVQKYLPNVPNIWHYRIEIPTHICPLFDTLEARGYPGNEYFSVHTVQIYL